MTIKFGKGFEKQAQLIALHGAPKTAEGRFAANCKALRKVLQELGVGEVRMDFYGSGDSGSFEKPQFDHADLYNPDDLTVTIWEEKGWYEYSGKFKGEVSQTEMSVAEAVEKTFECYVNAQNVDWYNNEGGEGYVELDVGTGVVDVNIDQHETVTHNAFYEEIELT